MPSVSVSLSLSLPSMHHKKIIFYAAMLATGFHVLFQLHPQWHAPYYGRLFKMGVYWQRQSFYPGRLNEMGVYSRRAFNQVNTVSIIIAPIHANCHTMLFCIFIHAVLPLRLAKALPIQAQGKTTPTTDTSLWASGSLADDKCHNQDTQGNVQP